MGCEGGGGVITSLNRLGFNNLTKHLLVIRVIYLFLSLPPSSSTPHESLCLRNAVLSDALVRSQQSQLEGSLCEVEREELAERVASSEEGRRRMQRQIGTCR